jgi:hypothetical protein
MPERPVSLEPTPDRSYNKEELVWHSDSWQPAEQSDAGAGAAPSPAPVLTLYGNLYDVIRNGAEQHITAAAVRSRLYVLEQSRKASGGVK